VTPPASLGTLQGDDGGPWHLRFTRHLHHPVERVWDALTVPEELGAWFPQRIVGDLLTPGTRLRFEGDASPGFDGQVLAVEPPVRLEFAWGPDTIRFDLVPEDGGCVLTLTDTIGELGKAARDGAGWHTCLDELEAVLDGTPPSFTTTGRWQEVHPGYVAAFGPRASTIGPPEPGEPTPPPAATLGAVSEVSERYRTVADGFTARVDGVAPGRWDDPTPCPEWTVRDLVAHVVGVHRRVVANVDGREVADVDARADLAGQWRQASGAVLDALGDEGRASTVVGGMFGEQTFESLVGRLLCADTLVHTWDLARATGQGEELDAGAMAAAAEFLAPIDEAIRRPGGFAPRIDPPAGADAQTRFLNFCGRAA